MKREYEKTYSLSFLDQQSAKEALDSMQFNYRSPLYNYHVSGTCTPTEHVIICPEGALHFLPEPLQKQAKECAYPINAECFLPTIYRFMDERYIDDFLNNGALQVSTFTHCQHLEDQIRKDGKEGQSIVVGDSVTQRMEAYMGTGDNVFLLCSSLASEYKDSVGKVNKIALEITNVGQFVDECTKAIVAKGYHVLNILIGPCYYSEKKIYGTIPQEELDKIVNEQNHTFDFDQLIKIQNQIAGPKMYFQKPLEKAREMEYRMIWMVFPEPKEETLLIHLENPTQYSRKTIG